MLLCARRLATVSPVSVDSDAAASGVWPAAVVPTGIDVQDGSHGRIVVHDTTLATSSPPLPTELWLHILGMLTENHMRSGADEPSVP